MCQEGEREGACLLLRSANISMIYEKHHIYHNTYTDKTTTESKNSVLYFFQRQHIKIIDKSK
jgi:hypothetical protein